MADPSADERIAGPSSPATAFILFHPRTEGVKEQVSYNLEAWRVLSAVDPSVDLPSLCSRWKGLFSGQPETIHGRHTPAQRLFDHGDMNRGRLLRAPDQISLLALKINQHL